VVLLPNLPRINPWSGGAHGRGLIEGVLAGAPAVDVYLLSLVEVLVDGEELLDLGAQQLGRLVHLLVVV
jgi:hypothetical protein